MTDGEAAMALEDQRGKKPDHQRNFDVAMREPETGEATSQVGKLSPYAIVVVVLVLIALSLALLS